jgi:carbonic anhydrase/acetyltransferase-like protein (isoleucine patch superfamily)
VIAALGELVPRIAASAWVHPAATIIGDVTIGEQSSVWPGAVLRGDFGAITVGARTSIQDNAVIHAAPDAPTRIGEECVIAHLAFIESAVIEDRCLVGVGAVVLPGAHLCSESVAAAGAVLARQLEVPSGHRAQGVPASVVSPARPDGDYIARGAADYVAMAERYARAGIGATGPGLGG